MSLISFSALAQESPTRIELKKGDKAPFDGQLLSHVAVAKLISDHNAEIKMLKARIEYLEKVQATNIDTQKKLCDAKLDAEASKKRACEESLSAQKSVYSGAVERVSKTCERKWYESPYLHFTLGSVVFGALSGVISYSAAK